MDESAEKPRSSDDNPEDRDPNCSVWSVALAVLLDIMGVRRANSFGCGSGHAQDAPVVLVAEGGMRQLPITHATFVGVYRYSPECLSS